MTETTEDTFFEGQIRVRQHRDGYRFSIDAVILAQHAAGEGAPMDNGGRGRPDKAGKSSTWGPGAGSSP